MDRGASAAFLAELERDGSSPCFLVSVALDTPVYLTSAWRSVSFGGNEYVANGHFLGISGIVETAKLQINDVTLSVSGVDRAWVAVATDEATINRQVKIYKAFTDYNSRTVSSPILIFDGKLDKISIRDNGKTTTLSVSAVSNFADFDRRAGLHTNMIEHQIFFSGDKFFEFSKQLNRSDKWGQA